MSLLRESLEMTCKDYSARDLSAQAVSPVPLISLENRFATEVAMSVFACRVRVLPVSNLDRHLCRR